MYVDRVCRLEEPPPPGWATPAGLAKLQPLNAYGWSKQLFDRRVARLIERGAKRPPQWAGLKFFNVYGPNEYHKGGQKSVVAQIFPRAQAGVPCHLFRSHRDGIPDGGQKRDFVYVRDAADVVDWLMVNPQVNGIYNLGSGTARSFADMAGAVFKAAGREPQIEYTQMPPMIRDKYQYFTEARMDRLAAAGYPNPMTGLEEGIDDYVANYLGQPDPYR